MRDLDQLRERDEDTRGRKLGLLALGTIVTVGAVVAGLSMISPSSEPEEVIDPLAELSLSAGHRGTLPEGTKLEALRPESLSFPATLMERAAPRPDHDDALLEATVRAAEAEHAALAGSNSALPSLEGLVKKSRAELPAGRMLTSDNQRLAQLAQSDRLMAQALPKRATSGLAPEGSDGAFTLQAVAYEDREPAEEFAATLRSRGHKAFVTEAEVPGRGRYFRVRVGPFTTRKEAERYQQSFERDEHMHTILVGNAAK